MRRAHLLGLLAALLVAGCPGSTGDVGTVTPAPVPSQPPPATDAPASRSCDVGTPAPLAGSQSPRWPATPAAIPVENGLVDASALLERHDRALAGRSYRLTAPGHSILAAPNGSAYAVDSETPVWRVDHYVVDDRRFSYVRRVGGPRRYSVSPYVGGYLHSASGDRLSLTGRAWLAEALGVSPHRVATRRPDGWTVLTGVAGNGTGDGTGNESVGDDVDDRGVEGEGDTEDRRAVRALNSTVQVDPNGVVRSVDQRLVVEDDGVYRMVTRQFTITDVGTTTVQRPRWVCEAVGATIDAPE